MAYEILMAHELLVRGFACPTPRFVELLRPVRNSYVALARATMYSWLTPGVRHNILWIDAWVDGWVDGLMDGWV